MSTAKVAVPAVAAPATAFLALVMLTVLPVFIAVSAFLRAAAALSVYLAILIPLAPHLAVLALSLSRAACPAPGIACNAIVKAISPAASTAISVIC